MITRIVRLAFRPETVESFLSIFEASASHIRQSPGCQALELHRDADHPNVFYTVSQWENSDALEAYRQSHLFRTVWSQTKPLFADRPQAYSLQSFRKVPG